MLRRVVAIAVTVCLWACAAETAMAQQPRAQRGPSREAGAREVIALKPARVWDGSALEAHDGWVVIIRGDSIEAAGPAGEVKVPEGARTIDLPGTTVLPGLIDAHTHALLHPYDEARWDDQVLKEALALRVCRATNHLRDTLLSGFTTIRDLGTEGAGYADVGLKQAVAQGIIPGPRMLVVTRAIVATGSYAPKGFAPEFRIPQGAEEADGVDSLIRVVRDQIGKGADWIKIYADTAMGGAAVRPHFLRRRSRGLSRPRGLSASWSRPTPPRRKGCGARLWRVSRRSSTATAAIPKFSRSWPSVAWPSARP